MVTSKDFIVCSIVRNTPPCFKSHLGCVTNDYVVELEFSFLMSIVAMCNPQLASEVLFIYAKEATELVRNDGVEAGVAWPPF